MGGPADPGLSRRPALAPAMLLLATVLWGGSFPLTKALQASQGRALPGVNSWWLAALALTVRFGGSALVLAAVTGRTLPTLRRPEWWQGLWLGVFAAGGMLLQFDGLNFTAAST